MKTDPTTPDQGDERRACQRWEAYAKRAGLLDSNGNAYDGQQKAAQSSWFTWQACEKERAAAQPVAQEAITWSPAGYNKELAVDTTGKVRGEICEHSIDPRWDARANDRRLGEYLTRDQAKAAVLAALAAPQPSQGAEELLRDALTNLIETYGTDSPMWWQARAAIAAPHPPVSAEAEDTPHKIMCAKGSAVACIKAAIGGCDPGECVTGAEGSVISVSAEAGKGVELPPMTCKHSNRTDCALYESKRPSKEWYARKIEETLDDDFSTAAPSEPVAVRGEVPERVVLQAIRASSAFGKVSLTYESGPYAIDRPTSIAMSFANAVLALAGSGEKK